MKISKLIVIVICIFLALVGWISTVGNMFSGIGETKKLISAGDAYFERGLYQRAARKYEEALAIEPSDELMEKIVNAYRSRYEEGGDQDALLTALGNAYNAYPNKVAYVEELIALYLGNEQYRQAYNWVVAGERKGAAGDTFVQLKRDVIYQFSLRGQEYDAMAPETNGWYALSMDGQYGYAQQDLGSYYQFNFQYIGPFGEDNVRVETKDGKSLLMGTEGFVMGIFDFVVEEAGMVSEEKIAVKNAGKWYYYNTIAEKLFGGYEAAGAFQNGVAAVKENGKWGLIDATGAYVSDVRFDEILLDGSGYYLSNTGVMVAAQGGKYGLYNASLKLISENTWTDASACNGEWIAVQSGGKWGFVDSNGATTIEPAYDGARSFRNGLAAVCKNGKWGFINVSNYLAIDYQFDAAGDFNAAGTCLVCQEKAVPVIPEETQPQETVEGAESTEPAETQPQEKIVPVWTFLKLELGIVA